MAQSGPPQSQPQDLPPGGPPPQGWQSQPRQPQPPPPAAPPVQPGRAPSWTQGLTSTAPVAGPAGFTYADVPNRVVAYIIDAIIVGIINVIVFAVLVGLVGTEIFGLVLNLAAGFVISAAYFVYMWSMQRATVGMKLLGMQLGHETDGRTITAQQGLVRWAVLVIPFVLINAVQSFSSNALGTLLGLVGLVWLVALLASIAQSPTKQGYHDRMAHTIMVKAARRAA